MANPRLPPWAPDWLEAAFASPRADHDDGAAQSPPQSSRPVPTIQLSQTSSSSSLRRPTSSAASPGGGAGGTARFSATNPHDSSHVDIVDGSSLREPSRDTSTLDDSANTESTYVTSQPNVTKTEKNVIVTPRPDRVVNRKLRGIHLSMIAVNATLGTGLYWRGGQILELGGPLSVLLSFLLPGMLAWAVMQCITELLCIWPIPGAMQLYVSEFVDVELGIAVGVAYWFTYSVSFSALVATSAAEIHYWINGNKAFDGGVVYFLIPLILICVNSLRVDIYGWFEVVSSSIKLFFLLVIICTMVAINVGAGNSTNEPHGTKYWLKPTDMSLSISTFAYVGVEVVAASALEARWPKNERHNTDMSDRSADHLLIGQTVKFSAVYIPVLATIAYILAGVLASFNIRRDDCRLPRLSWADSSHSQQCTLNPRASPASSSDVGKTSSAFVAIAEESRIPSLNDVFNVFLVFTALTCACTNLYVASRSLFGLTTRLDGSDDQPLFLRALAWFGKTDRRKVPMRAMIFSALAFCWVPFLQLHEDSSNISMASFIEILTTMGSDGVIIVWACECWAFIRYYHCIKRHRATLEMQKVSQVRRWDQDDSNDYPYRSHMQPALAYMALAGCIFILVVSNSALLWNGFHATPFLSTFLLQFVFLALWATLKLVRGAKWTWVDLGNVDRVVSKIRNLHDIRLGAS
ncbi:amino acid transporter [Purpureocillium lilacinum]|uniref:Amino acid transporter n=1 Tax=Purpureocillium lilacinum TaxID=33203 RepID=A0A179G9S4_PURLI|nr:amino acid transporter [Purpureocillium lilacinum]GJN70984.1 hypothetical protein PLICBS_005044 [Purpureocillium lilacinum]